MTPNVAENSSGFRYVEYQYDADTPPSVAVVRGIAAIEDVASTDLEMRLYDHIDSEALNRLVADNGSGATVTVDLTLHTDQKYEIRIRDDRKLVVQKVAE